MRLGFAGWALAVVVVILVSLALLRPALEPVAPNLTPDRPSPAPSDTQKMRAAALRNEGLRRCEVEDWARCAALLDQAVAGDPTIASEPAVVAARQAIANGAVEPDAGKKALPP